MAAAGAGRAVRAVLMGAGGRMGQALVRAAQDTSGLTLSAAIVSPSSPDLGRDVGELAGIAPLGIAAGSDLGSALADADVALDFSRAAALAGHLAACRAARKPLLIGVTGYGAQLEEQLTAASGDIALLVAANTSLGVTLLTELVRIAARVLPQSFDIDVFEVHHRDKRDAPSGTALALGAAARAARQAAQSGAGTPARGSAARAAGEIGFAALRAGDVVGEHSVLFSGAGEQLELRHRALDRSIFARGALSAALWLASRPPGRYSMPDVMGLKSYT